MSLKTKEKNSQAKKELKLVYCGEANANDASFKNCIFGENYVKKCPKMIHFSEKYVIKVKNGPVLQSENEPVYLTEFEVLKLWVRTLLSSYSNINNVIKIIDQIIKNRATNPYLSAFSTTYDQIEKVIDFVDRKNKLLNLSILIKNLIATLNPKERELVKLKFGKNKKVEIIAKEQNFSVRYIFTIINKIIEKLVRSLSSLGWSSSFLVSQLDGEAWIDERFKDNLLDYLSKSKKLVLQDE